MTWKKRVFLVALAAAVLGIAAFAANLLVIEGKLQRLAEVKEVDVQVQLDPPWDQTKMSDAARLQLGLM